MLIRYHTEAILSIPAPAPLRPYASVRLPFGSRIYAVKKRFSRRIKTNRKCGRSSFFIKIFFNFLQQKKRKEVFAPRAFLFRFIRSFLFHVPLFISFEGTETNIPSLRFFFRIGMSRIFFGLFFFFPSYKKVFPIFFSSL